MKHLFVGLCLLFPLLGQGQGYFFANNFQQPTRIGSASGPFAGPGIWGQFLVGTNTDSLTLVGPSLEHSPIGYVGGGTLVAPDIPPGTYGFIQMVAWDGNLWGTSLAGVPADQLGRTDIVRQYFSYDFQPAFAPFFTMPAIVPIPEPSTYALGAVGLAALWLASRTRQRKEH